MQVVTGFALADRGWLTGRRDAARLRYWPAADDRAAAILWWWSATAVLAEALLNPGRAARPAGPAPAGDPVLVGVPVLVGDPALAGTELVEHDGLLLRAGMPPAAGSPAGAARRLGQAVAQAWSPVVAGLSACAGTRPAPVWAVAADAVTGALLARMAPEPGAPDAVARARAWADDLAHGAGGRFPAPRLELVDGPQGTPSRVLRRSSCCLMLEVAPAHRVCASCPRQPAAVRRQRIGAQLRAIAQPGPPAARPAQSAHCPDSATWPGSSTKP